jgi:hypothetical protein
MVNKTKLPSNIRKTHLDQHIVLAFLSLKVDQCMPLGFDAFPFKMSACQPSRLRSLSALVDARSPKSSFWVA